MRFHFLRSEKRIKVMKVGNANNLADMFNKSVPHGKFEYCLDLRIILSC